MMYEYTLVKSRRKTMAVEIKKDGQIIVRVPNRVSRAVAEKFLEEKSEWIEKTLSKIKAKEESRETLPKFTERELYIIKKRAKQEIPFLVEEYASIIGVTYEHISIRAQNTLWGSCTAEGNLNFNCLLVLLPERVIRYVVVHELCHRKEMNHSQKFWQEVGKILPDYKELRKQLKDEGEAYLDRL